MFMGGMNMSQLFFGGVRTGAGGPNRELMMGYKHIKLFSICMWRGTRVFVSICVILGGKVKCCTITLYLIGEVYISKRNFKLIY